MINQNNIKDDINIFTYHKSKGLEFDDVFLPSVNEGTVPSLHSLYECSIEEERRLFYVGMTRAKDSLYVSTTQNSNRKPMLPSRFLDELDV